MESIVANISMLLSGQEYFCISVGLNSTISVLLSISHNFVYTSQNVLLAQNKEGTVFPAQTELKLPESLAVADGAE